MILLVDVLNAARRGEMGSHANAGRYCRRVANTYGEDCGAYLEAAEILEREHLEKLRLESVPP
jgi:hypothetical protein